MAAPPHSKRDRLSLAFLSHQVEQLEHSVESIHFSRDPRLYDSTATATRTPRRGQRERRVVDCSAFIHALPLLKRWVREDTYQVIVPLQVFSTLDVLKKAPNPLHTLAREATRFLETQLSIARQIESEALASGLTNRADWDKRVRLRAQFAHEELRWTAVEESFALPEGFVDPSLDTAEGDPEQLPGLPTAGDVPRSARSTLQCALYFQTNDPAPTQAIVLFHDPSHTPLLAPVPLPPAPARSHGSEAPPLIDFRALASGHQLSHWAAYFALPTSVISTAEVASAREWAAAHAKAQAATQERQLAQASVKRGGGGRGGGQLFGFPDTGRGSGGGGRGRGGRNDTRGEQVVEEVAQSSPAPTLRGRGRPAGVLFVP